MSTRCRGLPGTPGEAFFDRTISLTPTIPAQVSILIGLAGLLSTLHSLSLSADQFCPLQPSSIRVDPSPDSMHALDVRLAPAAALDHTYERVRTSARDRGVIPQCLLDADGLCSSPPGHAGARGTLSAGGTRAQDRMAADVWRLGALGGVLLASTAYCGDAAARVARAGTALELLEGLSGDGRFTDLLTTLRVRLRCSHAPPSPDPGHADAVPGTVTVTVPVRESGARPCLTSLSCLERHGLQTATGTCLVCFSCILQQLHRWYCRYWHWY